MKFWIQWVQGNWTGQGFTAADITHQTYRAIVALLIMAVGALVIWRNTAVIRRALSTPRSIDLLFTAFCSTIILLMLRLMGFEASYYPLQPLIDHPGVTNIIGHRLLFSLIASGIHAAVPALNTVSVYLASQVIPVIATVAVVGKLSKAASGGNALAGHIGRLFLVIFLSSTFSYYTFYDVGIVGFYAAVMLCLYRKRYWAMAALLILGTLNHENIVIAILAAAWATWGKRNWPAAPLAVSLAGYAAIRVGLEHFYPSSIGDIRFWTNVHMIAVPGAMLAISLAILAFRWIFAFLGAPLVPEMRRFTLALYPMLFLATFAFGQFYEARQFDAAIPVEALCATQIVLVGLPVRARTATAASLR